MDPRVPCKNNVVNSNRNNTQITHTEKRKKEKNKKTKEKETNKETKKQTKEQTSKQTNNKQAETKYSHTHISKPKHAYTSTGVPVLRVPFWANRKPSFCCPYCGSQ